MPADLTSRPDVALRHEVLASAMLEASPDCIKLLDLEGRLRHMNAPGMCLMELPSFAQVEGLSWWALWPQEAQTVLQDAVARARAGERSRFEAFCPTFLGTPKCWDVIVSPVYGAHGELEAVLAVSRDITERHTLLEQLREQQHRLETAHQAQKRFVADAAHELRAPLTAVAGNLELLERYPEMAPQDRQEAVSEAAQEAARLGRVLSDLLTLARGEGVGTLERRSVRLDQVLHTVLRSLRPRLGAHTLSVPDLPSCTVQGDPDRLHQLALILLDNALKYTPAGGEVGLRLECREPDRAVRLCVWDTGPGIPAEEQAKVFERFYRASSAVGQGGSGLGLSIAQWITEVHGGEITLESEPGQGSCFTVLLPQAGHTDGQASPDGD